MATGHDPDEAGTGKPHFNVQFPDWQAWLEEAAPKAAPNAEAYALHLAAAEWSLTAPLDINRKEDFQSLASINIQPFEHQVQDAIVFFRRLSPRGLIADDVGLGKTITAGLIAAELLNRGRIESLLVVCPKSIMNQWKEELSSKFGIDAEAAVGTDLRELQGKSAWITTYQTARSKMDLIRQRKFDLLVLDESHTLRNLFGTQKPPQTPRAFERLMKDDPPRYVLMLTATPIQNRLWDIYSLTEILRAPEPNPLGSPGRFQTMFIKDRDARVLRPGTERDFRNLVASTTVRTRRSDTRLLFPSREVRDSRLRPKPDELEVTERALVEILKFPKLVQYTYARSLMSSPWSLAASFEEQAKKEPPFSQRRRELEELVRDARAIKLSAKIDAVVSLCRALNDSDNKRLIVFTMRRETLRHIHTVLDELGFGESVAIVAGGQDAMNQKSIADFTADPPRRSILLSTDVGAVGLNLQVSNVVVNYDLPWNPMVIEQRIGRVQRLGQVAAKVIVHNLILADTIEDHIVHRLMEKLNLFSQSIGEMEELLELCGFDEARRPLEQVIMDLVRKAAERKSTDIDIERMRESRERAEQRLKEMRAATDEALASIRPSEPPDRLEGLERVEPRMTLRDLLTGCLTHAGHTVKTASDGALFAKMGPDVYEIQLDSAKEPRAASLASDKRIVATPGSRGFDHITRSVREQYSHLVLDGTTASLDQLRDTLEQLLAPHGVVIEDLAEVGRRQHAAIGLTARAGAHVAIDSYETVVDVCSELDEHRVRRFLEDDTAVDPSGHPLEPCSRKQVTQIAPVLVELEAALMARIEGDHSIRRFVEHYDAYFSESVRKLAGHIKGSQFAGTTEQAVEFVRKEGTRNHSIRASFETLQSRFLAQPRVVPVGARGLLYSAVEARARIRNRNQTESHAIRISGVPLTGAITAAIPCKGELHAIGEAWACPGGHLVAANDYRRCVADACTAGSCEACLSESGMSTCEACGGVVCRRHATFCTECKAPLCPTHVIRLTPDGPPLCQKCTVRLEDGTVILQRESAVSAVSGRRGDLRRMTRSPVSGRPFFSDEGLRCELTGDLLPPDETAKSDRTGRTVRKDLVARDEINGMIAEKELLRRSDATGRYGAPESMLQSVLSGKWGLPDEFAQCSVCGLRALRSELTRCPETNRLACEDHFRRCEETGELVLPDGTAKCEVTGRLVRKSLLQRCPETGKWALSSEFHKCEESGLRVIHEALARSEVSGKTVCRSLLVACEESGRLALPQELATCSVTGKRVDPNLLFTCPETKARLLRRVAERCDLTGDLVGPLALGTCEHTGKRVRRSQLKQDEVSGKTVQSSLLRRCEVTGRATIAENLIRSAVSGKLFLKDLASRCDVSTAVALPQELQTCELTGKRVLPDLLGVCDVSGRRVLKAEMRTCASSGKRVAPDLLSHCSVTGKMVLHSLLAVSEVTGRIGQRELLAKCTFTGRMAFPDEMTRSEISTKPYCLDRKSMCPHCRRTGDPGELLACRICSRRFCPADIDRTSSICRQCAEILSQRGATLMKGGPLVSRVRQRYPWVRQIWERPGEDEALLVGFPWILALRHDAILMRLKRLEGTGEYDFDGPLVTTTISRESVLAARQACAAIDSRR